MQKGGILCPKCGGRCGFRSIKDLQGMVQRERCCIQCKYKFLTYEIISNPDTTTLDTRLLVRNRIGTITPWNATTLVDDLSQALFKKIPVKMGEIQEIVQRVRRRLSGPKVSTVRIEKIVLEELRREDKYAPVFMWYAASVLAKRKPKAFSKLVDIVASRIGDTHYYA